MFEKKANELMEKANFVQALGSIYATVEREMNWNVRKYHDADAEHSDTWFTDYEDDEMPDYAKVQLKAYRAVLEAIEKLAK